MKIQIIYIKILKVITNILCGFIPSKKIRYQIRAFISQNNKIKKQLPNIYSAKQTLTLLQKGYSIARIGDGELPYIYAKRSINFQKYDKILRKRLMEILKSDEKEKLLISIPHIYGFYYNKFYTENIEKIKPLLNYNRSYADTIITREPIIWGVKAYRKIWENKNVVFITSKCGRFDKDPRFFDNIKKSYFIDIPPKDAFDKYNEIIAKARKFPKNYIFLIAAGPTATVLAYDLYNLGYQALDIGHLPNCYQTGKREKPIPEKLPFQK